MSASLRPGRACQARGHPRLQRTRPRRVPPAALHRRGVGSPGGTDRIRGRAAVGVTAPIAEAQLVETVLPNQLAREGDRPRATSRVFRAPDAHREAVGLREEPAPEGHKPLLVPVMAGGGGPARRKVWRRPGPASKPISPGCPIRPARSTTRGPCRWRSASGPSACVSRAAKTWPGVRPPPSEGTGRALLRALLHWVVAHRATVPVGRAVTGRRRRSTDSSARSFGSTVARFSIRLRAARTSLGRFMLAAATSRP